jgi:hypothetical protein
MSAEKSATTTADDESPRISARDMTWVQTVEAFEAEAVWLTATDVPQLKALYAIAEQLDKGDLQAAKISQFTLVQRTLASRKPDDGKGAPQSEAEQVLAMFENNPGVWKA